MQPIVRSPFRRAQRGLSMIGILALLIVVASTITVTLKLLPHYIDYRTMQSVLGGLPASDVHSMARPAVFELIDKRFMINNLRDFKIRDIIEVERSRDGTVLKLSYERREHLFLNIDVVIKFNDRFEYR
ncbi:MAG: DUF4845 domain-containing protein [Pseudomonadales bacterium]